MTTTKYNKKQKLGEGTYSQLFNAENPETGEIVILKYIHTDQNMEGISSSSLREISILKYADHPNIVKLLDVFHEQNKIALVLEQMYTDLNRFINTGKSIKMDLIRSYSFQLLAGVYYLHYNGIIHGDIKPKNILLNKAGFIKLCDFGTSCYYHHPIMYSHENVKLHWYQPPEILIGVPTYDHGYDVWCCGCVIAEMILHAPLFGGDSCIQQLILILNKMGLPSESEWPDLYKYVDQSSLNAKEQTKTFDTLFEGTDPDLKDLVKKLLTLNPKNRISAKDALQHPFFDPIREALSTSCLSFLK